MKIASLLLTAILVVIGIILALTGKKKKPPTPQSDPDEPKTQDEVLDLWYWLGFTDDSPNGYWCVTAGWSGTGTILRYLAYQANVTIETRNGQSVFVEKPIGIQEPYTEENAFTYFIRMTFGKRHYGFPIINSLRALTIDRVVPVNTKTIHESMVTNDTNAPQPPEIVTGLTATTVKRRRLYKEITRPTRHDDVDVKDGARFSATSTLILVIDDPRPAFETYPDSLLQNISLVVSNFFSSFAIRKTWEEYKSAGAAGHKFTQAEVAELEALLKPFGGRIKQFTMSDPELNPAIQKQFDERATATAGAETTRIKADADRYKTQQEGAAKASNIKRTGVAEALVIERKAEAVGKRIEQVAEQLQKRGMAKKAAAEGALQAALAEFGKEAIENFKGSTFAPGKDAGIFVGTQGKP